jgi:hypothetical protein
MTPEYAAENGSRTDKYASPRQYRVTYYRNDEMVQRDFRSRELAERLIVVNGGSMVVRNGDG